MNRKWFWMMNYCKKHGISLAQLWAWKKAEIEWNALNDSQKKDR